jgi:hypothetical protein
MKERGWSSGHAIPPELRAGAAAARREDDAGLDEDPEEEEDEDGLRCASRGRLFAGSAFRGQAICAFPCPALALQALALQTVLLGLLLGLQISDELTEGREAALQVGGDLLLLRARALELVPLGREAGLRSAHPCSGRCQVLGLGTVRDHRALHGLSPGERSVGILTGQEHRQRVEVGAVLEHRAEPVGHQLVEFAQLRPELGDLQFELFALALQLGDAGDQALVGAVRRRDVIFDRTALVLGLGQIALDLREIARLRDTGQFDEQEHRQAHREDP